MVKPGYKQTEIGVIPEDWKIEKLANLSGGGMQNGTFYECSRKGAGVYFLNVGNLYETAPITTQKLDKFNATKDEIDRFRVKNGDLFFTRSSIVPSGIAYCNWYKDADDKITVFDSHVVRFKTDTAKVDPMYLYLQCISQASRRYFVSNAKVATMTTIDQSQIANCLIPVPSIAEQTGIAKAIFDMDNMVKTLEQLVSKKKAITQGVMQKLLTGKRRLSGFTREWQHFVFGELFNFTPNNTFTRAQMSESGKVKNIHYGDILTKYGAYVNGSSDLIPYISKEVDLARFADRCYLQSGDIIMADTAEDETVGKVLEVVNVDCPILAGQHTLLCRPKVRFAPKFLGYYLNAACYHDQLIPYIVGTKVSSVSKASVAQTELVVPDYEEQQAIAEILSDMDSEIEALEQKLAKYRQVKQGMMQQLLTGKIRLAKNEEGLE